jgi:hypothetical protein
MSKPEFFIYNGEHQENGQNQETTVITGGQKARLPFLSPETVGNQSESILYTADGTKSIAPRGGFFGNRGYQVREVDTPDFEISEYEPTLEITPRMTSEHIAELAGFLGKTLPDLGLIDPGESGIYLNDYTSEVDVVTQIAEPRERPNLADISVAAS